MAIRRVTGAVSPSELIFADANALGATYDGSGTTIERGETFTLPAAGTTAVSNGALRLEALKGDCTITNNGNSTLTNASGVDGTIVMRSGASDFPAFVRNSSMGSMSTPARESFEGSLTNSLGTFSGTLSSTATVPASIGGGFKLTGSYSGNLNGSSYTYLSHGAFSATYDTYLVVMNGQMTSTSATLAYLDMRLSKSNGTSADNSYYSRLGGTDKDGGAYGISKNNQSTMVLVSGIDQDNMWSAQFYVYKPATSNFTFFSGTGCHFRNNYNCIEQSFTGYHGANYSATGLTLTWANAIFTSTFDAKFYGITTT